MDNTSNLMLIGAVLLAVNALAFLVLGLPPLLRRHVRSTGERARAVILEKRLGWWGVYRESLARRRLIARQVILKLEIHPKDGPAYVTEDRFPASVKELTRLAPGSEVDVFVARSDPKWAVVLPETAAPVLTTQQEIDAEHGGESLQNEGRNNHER